MSQAMPRPNRIPERAERGFGLLLVVVAIAVLGFLSLSAFGIARREFRSAEDLGYAAEAFEAAEAGLATAAAGAASIAAAPLMTPQLGPAIVTSRTRIATSVVRLNGNVVFVSAIGERLDGAGEVLAQRRLGLVGKIDPAVGAMPARFRPLGSRGWVQLYE